MTPGNTRTSSAAGRYRRAAKRQKMEQMRNETLANKQTTLFENQLWGHQLTTETINTIKDNQRQSKQGQTDLQGKHK